MEERGMEHEERTESYAKSKEKKKTKFRYPLQPEKAFVLRCVC